MSVSKDDMHVNRRLKMQCPCVVQAQVSNSKERFLFMGDLKKCSVHV